MHIEVREKTLHFKDFERAKEAATSNRVNLVHVEVCKLGPDSTHFSQPLSTELESRVVFDRFAMITSPIFYANYSRHKRRALFAPNSLQLPVNILVGL